MENTALFVAFSLLLTFAEVMSNEPNVPNCPPMYARFSAMHTACQPKNETCHIYGRKVSDTEAAAILELHNMYRSNIATQGDQSNGNAPASNMMKMEWDKELSAVAQKKADSCVYEHDKGNERRVRNFGVGQNLAIQTITGATEKPEADWKWAVAAWFSEIQYFTESMNCGTREVLSGDEEVGHFTQLVWAKSFRVGCGYTLYKEGNTFSRLYACNYGPAGNVDGACVYKEGKACSDCPENTACTKDSKLPGLCQRTNDQAPYYHVKQPTLFNCNFRDPKSKDCTFHREGDAKFTLVPALSGQYLEIILNGGQKASLKFTTPFAGAAPEKKMCVQARYRKGPTLATDKQDIVAQTIFTIPSANNFKAPFKMPTYNENLAQKMSEYSMKLGWISSTEMEMTIEVPAGAKPQFFDLQYVLGVNGPTCPKLDLF